MAATKKKRKRSTKKRTQQKGVLVQGKYAAKAELEEGVHTVKVDVPVKRVPRQKLSSTFSGLQRVRMDAGIAYTTSLDNISINDLHALPYFKERVSIQTLNKWCTEDRWNERRSIMYSRIQEKLEDKLAEQIELAIAQEVQDTLEIRAMAMRMVKQVDDSGMPRLDKPTWAEAVKVVHQASKRLDEHRSRMAINTNSSLQAELNPKGDGHNPQVTTRASREELKMAANEILRRRRERKRMEAEATKKKTTKVVLGETDDGPTLDQD